MTSTLQIDCDQTDIARIVADVFSTMAGLELTPVADTQPPAVNLMTASVHFAGTWKGAVLVQCSREQAFELTARMMPGTEPETVTAEVRDVMGELANMVGGNLKSVLHPGVALSMPTVVEGSDYALHICGGNRTTSSAFASAMGVLRVTVVQLQGKH